jgi:DNA-binding GntR family transcriptional regulator
MVHTPQPARGKAAAGDQGGPGALEPDHPGREAQPGAGFVSKTFAVLEQIIERMDRAISTGSANDLIEADYNFHQATVQASDNSLFVSIYDTLRSFTLEEIKRCHEAVEYPLIPKNNHQQILKAIKSGDIVQIVLIYKQFVAENIDAVTRSALGADGRKDEITDDHRKEV